MTKKALNYEGGKEQKLDSNLKQNGFPQVNVFDGPCMWLGLHGKGLAGAVGTACAPLKKGLGLQWHQQDPRYRSAADTPISKRIP